MKRLIQYYGLFLLIVILITAPVPEVASFGSQSITVLGTWHTFGSQTNMRCICNQPIDTITPTFYVNISLTSPAPLYGAWIAEEVQSATTNMWHLLKNRYYSYPPEISLWFDLRYESTDPEPTGKCSWSPTDPTQQVTTTETIDVNSEKPVDQSNGISTTTTANLHNTTELPFSSTEKANESPASTVKSSTPEVTRPNDIIASCLCPCSCTKKTQEEIDAMIEEIIGDLKINGSGTALARRRLSSASDTRWLSRGIGCVGILVMTVVFGSILLADYKRFLQSFHMFLENIRGQS